MVEKWSPTVSYVQVPARAKGSNRLAVAGFVLALLGALCSFVPFINIFGDLVAVVGLVLGNFGLAASRQVGAGRGLSIAAIVLCVAALAISIVVNITAAGVVTAISPSSLTSTGASLTALRPDSQGGTAPSVYATSSCDVVQQALLNGTADQVNAGMLALVADESADQAARQYADYYTDHDKDHKDLQKLDATLITLSCT